MTKRSDVKIVSGPSLGERPSLLPSYISCLGWAFPVSHVFSTRRPELRKREMTTVKALDEAAAREGCKTDPFYMIEGKWLQEWRRFVTDEGERPGPITNENLLEPSATDPSVMVPREGLVKARDYRGLHQRVWQGLLELYGGGPIIARSTMDIYGPPLTTAGP